MPSILKQALAEEDLVGIWLYTYLEWGEQQADKYLDDFDTAITLLADQPLLCREREEFNPPVRIHHHAHHLVVYQTTNNGISVIRVLHENMDIEMQLDEST